MKDLNMEKQREKSVSARLLYTREQLPRLGINLSPSTLRRMEDEGKFPKRVRLGAHSVAWLASEVHEHIAKLAIEREAGR
jgi:prophage regulatory protein